MPIKTKIAFVTNFCTHYSIRLFELLAKEYEVEYFFTGGNEPYWEKKNKMWAGDFQGRHLAGFYLLPKLKITPGLFALAFKKHDLIIKTLDDRFSLPFVFLLAKIFRTPFILWTGLWNHPQTFFHKLSEGITKFIYRHSDAVVAYGDHVKKFLVQQGVKAEKIFCAHHSVDNRSFNQPVSEDAKLDLKKSLNIADQKVILYVGRLTPCKGLEYLIEALSEIRNSNTVMVFIGSGELKTALEQRCLSSNLSYRLLEHIPNSELFRYYAIADIFVLPSITTQDFKEPWGLVINEAMNQGCPVITTDAVGAAAGGLVIDGMNGLVVKEKDKDSLKKAILALINDPYLRSKINRENKRKISEWNPEKTKQGFTQAVDFLVGSKG